MGVMIINSTLAQMYENVSSVSDDLASTLVTVISSKINDNSDSDITFWENADESSLSLKDFLDFVAQPFVANLLISKDLDVDEKVAEETRLQSKKYGLSFNFNTDDGRMDDITMKNASLGFKEKVIFFLLSVGWMDLTLF